VHRGHVECLYVLEGELAVRAGPRELRAPAGSWLQIPAGTPHAVAPAGGGDARFLDVHAPGCGIGGFLRAVGEGGEPGVAAASTGADRQPAPIPA